MSDKAEDIRAASKKIQELAIRPGTRVRLLELSLPGLVDAVLVEMGSGHQVRVVYWWDGVRHSQWVYPEEIEVVK